MALILAAFRWAPLHKATDESSAADSQSAQASDVTPNTSSQSLRGRRSTRGRPTKFVQRTIRNTRSTSSQRRKRSDENIPSNKKSKGHVSDDIAVDQSESYMSVTPQPDTIQDEPDTYIENCMERIVKKFAAQMSAQIDRVQTEVSNKFTSINESLGNINARISIIENDHKKIQTDQGEKILTNENNIIANTNRIVVLEQELAQEKMANKILARSVDNLDQAGRNMNMFVAGLTPDQATKEGFLQFCAEKLMIPVEMEDIKSVFKIPSEKENL